MGSGSSRMAVRSPRARSDSRPKIGLASFLCGGASSSSSSAAPPQMEDEASENLVILGRSHNSVANGNLHYSIKESSLSISSENNSSSTINEHMRSNLSSNDGFKDCPTLPSDAKTSHSGKCLSESKELVPCVASACSGLGITDSKKTCLPSSSSKLDHLDPLLTTTAATVIPVMVVDDSTVGPVSHTSSVRFSSSISCLEPGDALADVTSTTEDPSDEILGVRSACPDPAYAASTSSLNLLEDEPLIAATSSATDLLTLGERSGSLRNVDVVSVSSNVLPSGSGNSNNTEARRNSRRLFWDALSRRTTRNYDSPSIFSSTEDGDDLGSHDRWLLDISDDLFGSRFDHDSLYLHRRSHRTNGRRWHSRSEIRERLLGDYDSGYDGDSRRTSFCPSGLHPDGTCSCDSLLVAEELSTRASISRIVLLAEALFEAWIYEYFPFTRPTYNVNYKLGDPLALRWANRSHSAGTPDRVLALREVLDNLQVHNVLDEIHRQPVPLSLSMVSLPAPESVVNSLPIKSHIKHDADSIADDVDQCYICLAEYAEADKIRVLPCHHEFHMACVDKWLTEIHGVCPLCRRHVFEDAAEGTVSEL